MKKQIQKILGITFLFAACTISSCKKDFNDPIETDQSSENATALRGTHSYGALPASEEQLRGIAIYTAPASAQKAVAAKVMLDHPPIGDQGSQGSCVGWGTATARAIDYYNVKGSTSWNNSTNIMSAAYIYNQIKVSDCSSGSYVTDALNLLKNQGVCTYSSMPYVENNCSKQPNSTQKNDASNKKIASWVRIKKNDVGSIKVKLAAKKAVVIAIQVDNLFDNGGGKDHIWKKNNGSTFGGHCIAITGYDDAKNAFYVQNSWGTNWGDKGMIWIDYGMFSTYKVTEVYSLN